MDISLTLGLVTTTSILILPRVLLTHRAGGTRAGLAGTAHGRGRLGAPGLTLRANSSDWEFVPIAGQTFTDSGTGTCH
jgi:hypothetical protein